jgi:D-alanyl-D-alanine carboxypeptidase
MREKLVEERIESSFRNTVQNDKKVKNAYLLVYSEKLGIDINIAEGNTGEIKANTRQAVHLASGGKMVTATVIGMLYDKGLLKFEDTIAQHLDAELMNGLHFFRGRDYSGEITIKHLLTQTSGLQDVFYPLLKKMMDNPNFEITVRDAVLWGKANLKPVEKPGQKHVYTDTNYYLLGLIIESITGKKFHEVIHDMIFTPVGMNNAYVNGYSSPNLQAKFPPAHIYLFNENFIDNKRISRIDYSGGGIVAPLNEYLMFMKALVNHQLVSEETLLKMIHDDISMGFPVIGFNYGYSIWKPKYIPLLMPRKFFCWGCVGATGAFIFYHPENEVYIIGTFNDLSYTSKALRFMFMKIIKPLLTLVQSNN